MMLSEKCVLGTVQFGMDYGISNQAGKPAKRQVFEIMAAAWENGIFKYDTAPAYGSEEIIGEFTKTHGIGDAIEIFTKISSLHGVSDPKQAILKSIERSFAHLHVDKIDVLFFHDAADSKLLLDEPAFFLKILNNYPINTLGVSVYTPEEIYHLTDSDLPLSFQFPFNVLDRRFSKVALPAGRRIARSIFLQGLLVSPKLRNKAPEPLLELHERYHAMLREKRIDPLEFAVSFVAFSDAADYFIFGIDGIDQLKSFLQIDGVKGSIEIDDFQVDEILLDPRTWK